MPFFSAEDHNSVEADYCRAEHARLSWGWSMHDRNLFLQYGCRQLRQFVITFWPAL